MNQQQENLEILAKIKEYYESLDQEIFNERKLIPKEQNNWKSTGFAQGQILTKYGLLHFKRRKYLNKETRKCTYFLDERLGIRQKSLKGKTHTNLLIAPNLEEEMAILMIKEKVSTKNLNRYYPKNTENDIKIGTACFQRIIKKKKMKNETSTNRK